MKLESKFQKYMDGVPNNDEQYILAFCPKCGARKELSCIIYNFGASTDYHIERREKYWEGQELLMFEVKPKKVTMPDGSIIFFLKGLLQKADGPTAIYPDGTKAWNFNGISYTQKRWFETIMERVL